MFTGGDRHSLRGSRAIVAVQHSLLLIPAPHYAPVPNLKAEKSNGRLKQADLLLLEGFSKPENALPK